MKRAAAESYGHNFEQPSTCGLDKLAPLREDISRQFGHPPEGCFPNIGKSASIIKMDVLSASQDKPYTVS